VDIIRKNCPYLTAKYFGRRLSGRTKETKNTCELLKEHPGAKQPVGEEVDRRAFLSLSRLRRVNYAGNRLAWPRI
jgi:hypothetical protein